MMLGFVCYVLLNAVTFLLRVEFFILHSIIGPILGIRNYGDFLPFKFDVFLTVHHSIDFFQITNLMHNSFILQQYVCYITILNVFRAAPCSSSGGQIVLLQPLVSSPSVNSRTVCRLRADSRRIVM